MSSHFSFSCFSCCHFCLLVVLALSHFCLSNQENDNVLCMEDERQALIRFKHDLIDETDRLASWVAKDRECCRWAGIACDNFTGHVQGIHLPGLDGNCLVDQYFTAADKEYQEDSKHRLKGAISPSLLGLRKLKHLDLSCNDFGGIQVPKFIGFLGNMRYLNLSNSNFGGIIPAQIGNLSELQILCLGNNFKSEYVPSEATSIMNMRWLSSLGMLHHLDMSGVDLSKAIDWLQVINTLPSLVKLHMSSCQLSSTHLYVPSLNLTSLSFLDLSYNYFYSQVPQWIFGITSLVSLDLSECNFHGPIPSSMDNFHNMTSLELLHVSWNDFLNSSSVLLGLSSSNLISLDISFCEVSSSVLDSLHNLTSLLSLDMQANLLTKRIPKSLGNLCNLREIYLSRNGFDNITLTYLLETFFECKSPALESLSLSMTNIVGTIPYSIGQFSFLTNTDLSMNQLSGPIPYSIGLLPLLETLDLGYNQLDGCLPHSIGQLSNLIYLDISYNLFTGVVTQAHFDKLVSLKILYGTRNSLILRPQVANWIPPFSIEYLFLNSWILGPQFPLWLQSQKNLTHLDLSNTSISSPMPKSFLRSLPSLNYWDMSENHMQGTLTLVGIPKTLEVVDLSSNEFSGSLHRMLCSNGIVIIKVLNLGNNAFSGVIPECWDRWPILGLLNLENNNLFGEIPRTLGSISSLQVLNMHGNKVSGGLPASLQNLVKLEILQLGRNELVGSIPTWIGTELTLLRILNLRANNFDGIIPQELCYLIQVQILDLANNNLYGNIPRCFNNFSVLSSLESNSEDDISFSFGFGRLAVGDSLVIKGREDTYNTILGLVKLLDLSSNQLVGQIPDELMSLSGLKSLNLSINQLTGRIPEKIGDMKALISFDLSENKLYGELPMSLSRLNFLSSFNVSYNNLTGRIPTGTQIQSLNESSFFGNKLCGAPLPESHGCVPVEIPLDTTQDQNENGGVDWVLIISIVFGFVTGLWMIMGPLIASRSCMEDYIYSFLEYTRSQGIPNDKGAETIFVIITKDVKH